MAVEDDIRGTGVLTNKAPELQTSEPAFDDAMGTYQGWMNYGNTKNLKYKLNNIGNGKVFK